MARSVERAVQSARDRHPTFDEPRQPTGPVYRELARIVQELQDVTLGYIPEYTQLPVTTTVTLPLAAFADGIALPACRSVEEVIAVDPASAQDPRSHEVALIDGGTRFARNTPKRSAWQEGDTLFLSGTAVDWQQFGTIEIVTVPIFSDVSADALQAANATLPLPDAAEPAVVARLAAFMARRSAGVVDAQLRAELVAEAERAESRYTDHLITRLAGTVFYTGDTYGGEFG